MTMDKRVAPHATAENAAEYKATSEKFTFCIDLLEISAHSTMAGVLVDQLEDAFDAINQGSKSCL